MGLLLPERKRPYATEYKGFALKRGGEPLQLILVEHKVDRIA